MQDKIIDRFWVWNAVIVSWILGTIHLSPLFTYIPRSQVYATVLQNLGGEGGTEAQQELGVNFWNTGMYLRWGHASETETAVFHSSVK
jgi:hypothetical protein